MIYFIFASNRVDINHRSERFIISFIGGHTMTWYRNTKQNIFLTFAVLSLRCENWSKDKVNQRKSWLEFMYYLTDVSLFGAQTNCRVR